MRLLKVPHWETETIEVNSMGGGVQRIAGQATASEVEIVVPDKGDEQMQVWNTLKYGPIPDLFDAMHEHKKIQSIAFPEDGVVLKGVLPYGMGRTAVWEGRVFKCKVDYFEVTDEQAFQRRSQSQL